MLDHKKWVKISRNFKFPVGKQIDRVDRPFSKDSTNIAFFSRKAFTSREGRSENLGEMCNNRDIYCYANLGVVNLEKENLCGALSFLHARPNFRKNEKLNF